MRRGNPGPGLALAGAFCLFLAARAGAQGAAPPAAPAEPATPAVINRNHHLGPGDSIAIAVEGFQEFSRSATLFSDGTIDYPPLGIVQCAGLTVKELGEALTEGLRKEVRRPVVRVTLTSVYVAPKPPPKPEAPKVIPKVTALGAVTRQGEMDLPEPRPLRALLAAIQPTMNADLSRIRVRYPDGSVRSADFSRFETTGEAEGDILIRGGEEIILLGRPPAPRVDPVRITVLGAVAKPGTFTVEGELTILEILEKVGGPVPGADLERVEVTGPAHKEKRLVNVDRYRDGDVGSKYIGRPNDEIVIPLKPLRVLVFGEVPKPGEVAIDPDDTLMRVFLQAGATPNADITKAQLIREGKDGKPITRDVNLRDIMRRKKDDEKLIAGDVLFIPGKKSKRGFLYYLSTVSAPLFLFRTAAFGF